MGESYSLFQPTFNKSVQVEVRPERLTCDAGAILIREVGEKQGLFKSLSERLEDPRNANAVTHTQEELLRTLLILRAQGCPDQDDADRLRHDPSFRVAVSSRRGDAPLRDAAAGPSGLASQPTLSRAVAALSSKHNREVLHNGLLEGAARRILGEGGLSSPPWLDMDSLPVRVHGQQAGAEYNGHYHATCYHPLVVTLGQHGDLLGCWLRKGTVHTAEGGLERLLDVVRRFKAQVGEIAGVRLDAGFPSSALLDGLEKEEVTYVMRVRRNSVLDKLAGEVQLKPHLPMPEETAVTRFKEFQYKAGSWSRARRIISVAIQEPDELITRSFYLLTDLELTPEEVLAIYRQRGQAESHFGEWMTSLYPRLSSTNRPNSHYKNQTPKTSCVPCDPFAVNEVLLLLSALSYNLVHAVRTLIVRATGRGWTLQATREKVLKVGARLLLGGRRVKLVISEQARHLWALVTGELDRLVLAPSTG